MRVNNTLPDDTIRSSSPSSGFSGGIPFMRAKRSAFPSVTAGKIDVMRFRALAKGDRVRKPNGVIGVVEHAPDIYASTVDIAFDGLVFAFALEDLANWDCLPGAR